MPSVVAERADFAGLSFGLLAAGALLSAPQAAAAWLVLATAGPLIAWIVWRDATSFTIPDGAAAALALIGCAARIGAQGFSSTAALSLAGDVALTGGALWILREAYYRWRGVDGLGFGDVKLAAAAGCLVGADGFYVALLAAALAGLACAAVRGSRFGDRLALGVLLAPAVWFVLAAETAPVWGPWT